MDLVDSDEDPPKEKDKVKEKIKEKKDNSEKARSGKLHRMTTHYIKGKRKSHTNHLHMVS